ncbi:MAG: Trm112 family protein [Candidatus Polarisedimenticolia bacterium]
MPVDPKLLEILACPLCKTAVELTTDGGGLLCRSCRRRYPIVDDIPVMLVDEATIQSEDRT